MYRIEQTDCFEWLRNCPHDSLHAVCTDPPYGILEFTEKELAKLRAGRGGVWRLPPKIGGSHRDPLPRFTVLGEEQKQHLRDYFRDWGKLLLHALVPGGHVCVAGHPIQGISNHPCLEPQHFMRIIVRALLPLGQGTIL